MFSRRSTSNNKSGKGIFPGRGILRSSLQPTSIHENELAGPSGPLFSDGCTNNSSLDVRPLAPFDACVETVDTMAAASTFGYGLQMMNSLRRFDTENTKSIDDCSVCVSPDGLIITNVAMMMDGTQDLDLDASIVVGFDGPGNDRTSNGFSCLGWSVGATSHSLRQCVDALQATGRFAESLCKAKEQYANGIRDASRKLFDDIWDSAAFSPKACFLSKKTPAGDQKEPEGYLEVVERDGTVKRTMRMGPLLQPGTTFHQAITAVEAYYSKLAQIESNRWRITKSIQQPIPTAKIETTASAGGKIASSAMEAAHRTQKRGEKRELALLDAAKRADEAQAILNQKKAEATKAWLIYQEAEDAVRERLVGIEKERELGKAREKEKERRMARQEVMKEKFVMVAQPVQKDMLELVSKVEDLSDFAPVSQPADHNPVGVPATILPLPSSRAPSPSFSQVDKCELEIKFGLAEKRLAATEADNAVEDAAGSLLNALSSVDTTHRSARIAAEACLLSAANMQKQSLLAIIKIEKESLQEQLKAIEILEAEVEKIAVRADLNMYIDLDKQYPGGRTEGHRDDNDDGGIASALAVLNVHSYSDNATGLSGQRGCVLEGWGSEEEGGIIGREDIEEYVDDLFSENDTNKLERAIDFLVDAVKDPNKTAQTHRAYVCYALNAKRSEQTEIKGKKQFDGLCRVISSLLSGCSTSGGDIANSKMCMMLSQTFFIVENGNNGDAESLNNIKTPDRKNRLFVKSKLVGHSLWNDDDFWDHALYQCISEALTQSEVMHNLQRAAIAFRTGSLEDVNEETLRKVKWHDFPPEQRLEAAAQLHSVVFAQLGALSHSMIEFGCGFSRAVAFVRRSAVRHQLPISQRTALLQHIHDLCDQNSDS